MSLSARLRVVALVLAAVLLAVLVATALAPADPTPHRSRAVDQTRLVLRLTDLPRGYLNFELQEDQGNRVHCANLTDPRDTPPKMGRFVGRFHPRGCVALYTRLYSPPGEAPGPDMVGTGVLAGGSAEAARAAWAVAPEMLGRVFHKPVHEVTTSEKVGAATRLFHLAKVPRLFGQTARKASFLVWRSGDVVAAVMALGPSFTAEDSAAAALARRQQSRIRTPTRYTTAERFDGEVPLDAPELQLPVYWLGRAFAPGGGLPSDHLFSSYYADKPIPEAKVEGPFALEEGPVAALHVSYERIWLATWSRADWPIYADSRTGQAITTWHCTQTRTVPVAGGTATIFGGYAKDLANCPAKAPQAFTAWVEVGGIELVVDAPFCATCIETGNPYGSFAGMEAIVRALVLRPRPVYQ